MTTTLLTVTTALPTLPPSAQAQEHLRHAVRTADAAYDRAFRVALRCEAEAVSSSCVPVLSRSRVAKGGSK